ncbi:MULTISPECIES: hypothetical protein [Pseudomonas]|uniref:Uncharacterized protein n=1 Tax=Pseudomonas eucalypticola TaxID=2599595 RepID=A0A7D5H0U7_9PSED|nr:MULTISPECIES: hypothetical protein [Pseudomonas]QKZ02562.1 hypothetical protein HWQ56_01640 [Pseudomonas eucalypticola]
MNEIFRLLLNIYRHLHRFLREYRALRARPFRPPLPAAMLGLKLPLPGTPWRVGHGRKPFIVGCPFEDI